MAARSENSNADSEFNHDKILMTLECPFTWEMDKISTISRNDKSIENDEYDDNECDELFAISNLMFEIIKLYLSIQTDGDKEKILEQLEKCGKILDIIIERPYPEVSVEVAEYVFRATECFVYKKLQMFNKMEGALKKVINVKFVRKMDKSTLMACKGICWSSNYQNGLHNAEKYIREALAENPKCDLWFYILAKNLRYQRKFICSGSVSKEEVELFEKAYKLSQNSVYGISLAIVYRESGNKVEARKMYERVFNNKPKNVSILLKLALGFTRVKIFDKADICFQRIEQKGCKKSSYYHYRGEFHTALRNFSKAKTYYLKATDNFFNLSAEKSLLNNLYFNKQYDVVQHLNKLLEKFKDHPQYSLQPLILDLAVCYLNLKNDVEKAIDYLLQAMEINPKAKSLLNYYDFLYITEERNMFRVIRNIILPMVDDVDTNFNEDTIKKAKKLQELANDYFSSQ